MRHNSIVVVLLSGMWVSAVATAAEDPTDGSIRTTHVVALTNGMQLRGTVVSEDSARVVLAIGNCGRLSLPRDRVAGIRAEQGSIPRSRPPAARPPEPTPSAPKPVAPPPQAASPSPDLTSPPVPQELREEIDRWLYHLGRTSHKYRIHAERQLKALGPVVVGPVLPYTHRPEWLIRCAALRIIAETGHPSGVQALWQALEDDEANVRLVAHEGLVKLTGLDIYFDPNGTLRSRDYWIERWRAALAELKLLP